MIRQECQPSSSTSTSSTGSAIATPQECLPVGWPEAQRRVPAVSEEKACLLNTVPSPFVRVISAMVVGDPRGGRCGAFNNCPWAEIKPYVAVHREYGNDWPPFGYTMVGKVRLNNFRAAIDEVNRNNIPGAIVEMGVWRGGAMIMAAAVTSEMQEPRSLFLYDAYGEIPGGYMEPQSPFWQCNWMTSSKRSRPLVSCGRTFSL
jgi:hypothetical protein